MADTVDDEGGDSESDAYPDALGRDFLGVKCDTILEPMVCVVRAEDWDGRGMDSCALRQAHP